MTDTRNTIRPTPPFVDVQHQIDTLLNEIMAKDPEISHLDLLKGLLVSFNDVLDNSRKARPWGLTAWADLISVLGLELRVVSRLMAEPGLEPTTEKGEPSYRVGLTGRLPEEAAGSDAQGW